VPIPSPSGRDLVLVPTELELRQLDELGPFPEAARELCGFGPVSAAARTAQRLAELRPGRVLLLGIAGSLDPERAPLGSACLFERVRLDGVGAGAGTGFLPPSRLGFPQWEGPPGPVEDALELAPGGTGELLTVCAASASPGEASARRERHPAAVAEDMEGFGVALACHLARVPLAVVRGISNAAGERERRTWRVPAALAAARRLALEWLAQGQAARGGRRA
jgi:futalosine hydrolase